MWRSVEASGYQNPETAMSSLKTIIAAAAAVLTTASVAAAGDHMYAPPSGNADWGGLYIGASVGYAGSDTEFKHTLIVPPLGYNESDKYDLDANGVTGTLTVGYDHVLRDRWVLGAFVDYTFGELDDEGTKFYPAPVNGDRFHVSYDNMWAVGAKIGYIFDPNLMGYMTVGYTSADFEFRDGFGNLDEDLDGYFIGAGLERKIRGGLSLNLDYRYSDYGDETLYEERVAGCCYERYDLDHSIHSIRLGLVYRFGGREPQHVPMK